MARPQQNDRILRLRELARQAADAEWPEEERTNPVIVQVMTQQPEKQPESKSDVEKGAAAAATVMRAIPSTWPQIVGLIVVSIVAGAVYYLTHR